MIKGLKDLWDQNPFAMLFFGPWIMMLGGMLIATLALPIVHLWVPG